MFSNGTESVVFSEDYCWKCSRFKADAEGTPYSNSCSIEKMIASAMFDKDCFPKENVFYVEGKGYVCDKFTDKKIKRIECKSREQEQINGQMSLV